MSSEVCSSREHKPQAIIEGLLPWKLAELYQELRTWQYECAFLVSFSYEMLTKMLISSAANERG